MNMRTVQEQERYINPYTDFGFKRLFEQAEIAKFTPKERQAYEESVKEFRDYYNTMVTAHKNGRAEGLDEGQTKGRAEGERKKALDVARNLKAMGLSADDISKATGLSPDEVKSL